MAAWHSRDFKQGSDGFPTATWLYSKFLFSWHLAASRQTVTCTSGLRFFVDSVWHLCRFSTWLWTSCNSLVACWDCKRDLKVTHMLQNVRWQTETSAWDILVLLRTWARMASTWQWNHVKTALFKKVETCWNHSSHAMSPLPSATPHFQRNDPAAPGPTEITIKLQATFVQVSVCLCAVLPLDLISNPFRAMLWPAKRIRLQLAAA